MIQFFALALALMIPMQAAALSCLAPSVVGAFENARKSTDTYVVVNGVIMVDVRKMPRANETTQLSPEMTRIPAVIKGRSLSKTGFQTPFDQKIILEVACFGPWCGTMASGADMLAFLRRDNDGTYALGINPCGGDVFVTPQPTMLKQVHRCFIRGKC